MKKFQFTLEKLMDFREQELDRQKNALGVLRVDLQRINEETEQLRSRVIDETNKLNNVCSGGAQAYEVSVRKRYIVMLQQDIHYHEEMARRKQEDINKQLGVVVEATKDVRTLEKLEEKQLEEYKALESKENEHFIEEFVSNAAVRGTV